MQTIASLPRFENFLRLEVIVMHIWSCVGLVCCLIRFSSADDIQQKAEITNAMDAIITPLPPKPEMNGPGHLSDTMLKLTRKELGKKVRSGSYTE